MAIPKDDLQLIGLMESDKAAHRSHVNGTQASNLGGYQDFDFPLLAAQKHVTWGKTGVHRAGGSLEEHLRPHPLANVEGGWSPSTANILAMTLDNRHHEAQNSVAKMQHQHSHLCLRAQMWCANVSFSTQNLALWVRSWPNTDIFRCQLEKPDTRRKIETLGWFVTVART